MLMPAARFLSFSLPINGCCCWWKHTMHHFCVPESISKKDLPDTAAATTNSILMNLTYDESKCHSPLLWQKKTRLYVANWNRDRLHQQTIVWLHANGNRLWIKNKVPNVSLSFKNTFYFFFYVSQDWLCRNPEVEKCRHRTEEWWDGHWTKKHTCAFGVSRPHSSTRRPAQVSSSCLSSHWML